ncbi:MAG TPA: DUF6763 family protein [Spongiibacteraceae bacterium]|nr:hypothetical protein [Spongiibacteraceae bacterium]HUH38256.1 DUF6763 family protein [Spongiibacteraceae bacterium]
MTHIAPEVRSWYRDIAQDMLFEVVAIDEAAQTIDIQLVDGAVCEYDLDSWRELELETAEEPEDWRDAYALSQEDCPDPDSPQYPEDWSGPISQIEPDTINGLIDD